MKEINLTELVRDKKGNILWNECIGLKLEFSYDDIEDCIEIMQYNNKTNKVLIKYQDRVKKYNPTAIIYCNFKDILGIYNSYKFNPGDIIKEYEILNQIWLNHKRAYLCKCLKCMNEVEILQYKFIKSNTIICPECRNKI